MCNFLKSWQVSKFRLKLALQLKHRIVLAAWDPEDTTPPLLQLAST